MDNRINLTPERLQELISAQRRELDVIIDLVNENREQGNLTNDNLSLINDQIRAISTRILQFEQSLNLPVRQGGKGKSRVRRHRCKSRRTRRHRRR